MGWLGWTPDVVMAADVNLIEMALASKSELLAMIYGDGKKPEDKKKPTPKDFKAFAQQNNNRRKAKADG